VLGPSALRAAILPPAGEALTLHVDTTSGALYFTGVPGSNMSFYQITSASQSLDDDAWNSLQDQSILNPHGTITTAEPGQIVDWMEMAHNNGILQDMACANMMPGMNGLPVIFDTAERTYSIGAAFQVQGSTDLGFLYNVDLDYTPDYLGTVVYETPEPASLAMVGGGAVLLVLRRRRVTLCFESP
jgi:hypothetical protein